MGVGAFSIDIHPWALEQYFSAKSRPSCSLGNAGALIGSCPGRCVQARRIYFQRRSVTHISIQIPPASFLDRILTDPTTEVRAVVPIAPVAEGGFGMEPLGAEAEGLLVLTWSGIVQASAIRGILIVSRDGAVVAAGRRFDKLADVAVGVVTVKESAIVAGVGGTEGIARAEQTADARLRPPSSR
jgi:hypothetical protein